MELPVAKRPHVGQVRVLSNLPAGPMDHVIAFQLPPGADRGQPGQFWQVRRGTSTDPLLGRPLSTFDLPPGTPDAVELLLRVCGKGTSSLAELRPGERAWVVGPLGRPFASAPDARRHVLVAGGVGIAPFPYLARKLKDLGEVVLLAGAGREPELVGLERFDDLGVDIHVATDDGSVGHRGYVTDLLSAVLAGGPTTARSARGGPTETVSGRLANLAASEIAVYTCGPGVMMRKVADLCARAGVACQVSMEQRMACGVGVCYGCVARLHTDAGPRYVRTCLEGPALAAERVADWECLIA